MVVDRWMEGRAPALLCVLALALAGSACGSDDDGDGAAAGSQSGTGGSEVSPETKKEIEAVYDKFAAGLKGNRYQQVCSTFSEAHQKRYAAQTAKLFRTPIEDCLAAMQISYKGIRNAQPADLTGVKMDGATRAIVSARSQGLEDVRTKIAFVKADDEWKIDGPIEGK